DDLPAELVGLRCGGRESFLAEPVDEVVVGSADEDEVARGGGRHARICPRKARKRTKKFFAPVLPAQWPLQPPQPPPPPPPSPPRQLPPDPESDAAGGFSLTARSSMP